MLGGNPAKQNRYFNFRITHIRIIPLFAASVYNKIVKIFKIILPILIIVVLGLAGFYLYKKNKPSSSSSTIKSICQDCQSKYNPFGFAGPSAPDNFNNIQALGVKFARESISWETIEPSENQFNFDVYKESDLAQYGLEIIARLKLGQIWATKCDKSIACSEDKSFGCPSKSADCPPKDLGNWSDKGYSPLLYDFIFKSLADTTKTSQNFEYLIVGNEVNTPVFWHGSAQDYLKTRSTIYKAIKDINVKNGTNYKVVDNGIAGMIWGGAVLRENYCTNDQDKRNFAMEYAKKYFRRIYDGPYTEDALAKRINCANPSRDYLFLKEIFKKDPNLNEVSFDVMSYHFYEPWDTQEEVINWIGAEMKKNGYDKPIMNTEGGYRDTLHLYDDTPTLKQDVANEIPKLHVIALANNIKTWLWLPFTEREGQFYGPEWKGLVSEDQKILPAYYSYQIMVAKLAGFDRVEKIDKFQNAHVYKVNFVDKKSLYVIWANDNVQIDLSSEIDGNIQITDVNQKTKNIDSSKIDIGPSPIYVEEI